MQFRLFLFLVEVDKYKSEHANSQRTSYFKQLLCIHYIVNGSSHTNGLQNPEIPSRALLIGVYGQNFRDNGSTGSFYFQSFGLLECSI